MDQVDQVDQVEEGLVIQGWKLDLKLKRRGIQQNRWVGLVRVALML